MKDRWTLVFIATAIAAVTIVSILILNTRRGIKLGLTGTSFDTQLVRSDAPLGTQERLDSHSDAGLSGPPAQCANDCSPCSKSPEYRNLTCHDIIETQAKKRPQLEYRRKVILSPDTENLFYAWFAPITSLLWMEVMKWKRVYIFVYRTESDIGPVLKVHHQTCGGNRSRGYQTKKHTTRTSLLQKHGGFNIPICSQL